MTGGTDRRNLFMAGDSRLITGITAAIPCWGTTGLGRKIGTGRVDFP